MSEPSKTQQYIVISGILTVLAVVLIASAFFQVRITATGTVKGIGVEVFADYELTKKIDAVNWGEISPGGSSQVTFWILSTSTTDVTLDLITENWKPSHAESYISVTWDWSNSVPLAPNEKRASILTLTVSSEVQGITDFSFDIVVSATG